MVEANANDMASSTYESSEVAARTQGERIFIELVTEHQQRTKEERDRIQYAFEARRQIIGRIGLPAVREHRRKRLEQEHQARLSAIEDAEIAVPDLHAVIMLRLGNAPGMEAVTK